MEPKSYCREVSLIRSKGGAYFYTITYVFTSGKGVEEHTIDGVPLKQGDSLEIENPITPIYENKNKPPFGQNKMPTVKKIVSIRDLLSLNEEIPDIIRVRFDSAIQDNIARDVLSYQMIPNIRRGIEDES